MQHIEEHCPTCLGTGTEVIEYPVKDADVRTRRELLPCPACLGTGKGIAYRMTVDAERIFNQWLIDWQDSGGNANG